MASVGAVLTFPEGVTEEQVADALAQLDIDIETAQINTFNPAHGGPVWYVP